jgi:hypothetical protein
MTEDKVGELAIRLQINFTNQLELMKEANELSSAEAQELVKSLIKIIGENPELRELVTSESTLHGLQYINEQLGTGLKIFSQTDEKPVLPPFPNSQIPDIGGMVSMPPLQSCFHCLKCKQVFDTPEEIDAHECKPFEPELLDLLGNIADRLSEIRDRMIR